MQHQSIDKRALIGVLLLIVGGVLLLERIGLIPEVVTDIVLSWQMLLIGLGILNLSSKRNHTLGVILIVVGIFFLINKHWYFPYELRRFIWPVAFIILGIALIAGRKSAVNPLAKLQNPNDLIDDLNLFGGGKTIITSQEFLGGKVTSIFGGGEYDLTQAKLSSQGAIIDTVNIFGGNKFVVPRDWEVKVDVASIFGGFSDSRLIQPSGTISSGLLIIKGFSLFGGGEVRNI